MDEAERIAAMTDEERDTLFFRAEVSQSLARIYDVLLALLAVEKPEKAAELLARHTEGRYWYPSLARKKDIE